MAQLVQFAAQPIQQLAAEPAELMAQPVQLNLPPFLRDNKQALDAYSLSQKEFYSCPAAQPREIQIRVERAQKAVRNGAYVGGVTGGVAGGLAAWSFSWVPGLGAPLALAYIFKTTIAVAAGATVGASVGTAGGLVYVKISLDQTYTSWRKSVEKSLLNNFQSEIENTFDKFLCPITKDFPAMPLRDHRGQAFDQTAIFNWIDDCTRRGIQPHNPLTREPLTREDLSYYADYAIVLSERARGFFGNPNIVFETDKTEILRGLQAALDSAVENHNTMILTLADRARERARAAGARITEADQIYQNHRQGLIERPQLTTPSKIVAIVTSESLPELGENLVKGAEAVVHSAIRCRTAEPAAHAHQA